MLGLAGGRLKGVKPRAQCMPSIGGSCCPLMSDQSCGADPEVSEVWANVTTARSSTNRRTNPFLFMRTLPFEIEIVKVVLTGARAEPGLPERRELCHGVM